ncbi:AraC family transcriptional regulator [Flavobacteriaceae bacterium S356]|uniref:AraC family transcriptional regulator n=1 Tax=Asprobacillus argus TaxID=3076534 RepID=A0ABU3LGZ4_9FLAO|nr:AraC family transcriptional regulator [Flavobacteriaceae bacterium S356]
MKVLPFQIPKPEYDALIYQEDHEYIFYDKFHQHKEIQVSLIAKGSGTLIVGDTINDYKEGDVLVIGGNLPHVFKSDNGLTDKSLMLTLFFTKSAFGGSFFELEELRTLHSFFKKAENGFKAISTAALKELFTSLKKASKFDRFVTLLRIVKILSSTKTKTLSSFVYEKKYTDIEGKRMQDVMEHTMNHYQQYITLDDIATVANMTKNAFCKYFKKRTNKTYFQFLSELRVENASKLLTSNHELSIAEIAYQCGFRNLSNFNRQFLSIKKKTPSKYRIEH